MALLGGGPVERIRTSIRLLDSEKWKADEIEKLRATPKRPNPQNAEQKDKEHA